MLIYTIPTIIICLASFIHGVVEGYEFDGRKSFERKWNIPPISFWGKFSHQNKTKFSRYFGVIDFYHVADDLRKYLFILSGYWLVGLKWYEILIVLILGLISMQSGLQWVRKDSFVPYFLELLTDKFNNYIKR